VAAGKSKQPFHKSRNDKHSRQAGKKSQLQRTGSGVAGWGRRPKRPLMLAPDAVEPRRAALASKAVVRRPRKQLPPLIQERTRYRGRGCAPRFVRFCGAMSSKSDRRGIRSRASKVQQPLARDRTPAAPLSLSITQIDRVFC
jgi:hypothetical protein